MIVQLCGDAYEFVYIHTDYRKYLPAISKRSKAPMHGKESCALARLIRLFGEPYKQKNRY